MRIPKTTQKPRFYVALSLTEAYSSWGSLLEAQASIGRFEEKDPFRSKIKGIVENGPLGPRFVFVTHFPVNEHDEWVDPDGDKPLLRSEIVKMCRYQLRTRDRWLLEMDSRPDWQQQTRKELLSENAEQHALAEKVIADWGAFFPEEQEN